MIRWHEFEQTLGDSEGQGSLAMGLQRVRHNWVTEQQQIITWANSLDVCREDIYIYPIGSVCLEYAD